MHLPGLLQLPLATHRLCRLALVRRDVFLPFLPHRDLDTPLHALRPALPRPPPQARSNLDLPAPLLLKDRVTRQRPPPQLWRVLLEIDDLIYDLKLVRAKLCWTCWGMAFHDYEKTNRTTYEVVLTPILTAALTPLLPLPRALLILDLDLNLALLLGRTIPPRPPLAHYHLEHLLQDLLLMHDKVADRPGPSQV